MIKMKSFQIKYMLLFEVLFTIAFTNDIKLRHKKVKESLNELNNTNFSKFEKPEVNNYDKNDVENEDNDEKERIYDDNKVDDDNDEMEDDDDEDENDDEDNDYNENESDKIVDSLSLFELKKHLLGLYDRNSRPIFNSSRPLMIKLGVNVAQINNLDVNFQVIFCPIY